jgi:hypothetical protein
MICLSSADDQQVMTAFPPSRGRFTGWEWQRFYNAILYALRNPASQMAYMQAWNEIANLPAVMQFTPQIMVAAWARFTKIYPYRDNEAALRLMETFLTQSGRMQQGDQRQWWTVEQEWQAIEAQALSELSYIPFASPSQLGQDYERAQAAYYRARAAKKPIPIPYPLRRRREYKPPVEMKLVNIPVDGRAIATRSRYSPGQVTIRPLSPTWTPIRRY